jgi:hypothetical protein
MITLFGFGRLVISDEIQHPHIAESAGPFHSGEFNCVKGYPWSSPVNGLCFIQTVGVFSQGIVINSSAE